MNLTASFAKPIARIKQKLNNDFIRNLGWLGGSELINRALRLVTVVVLSRSLNYYDYGLAALVLTIYEFTQVFTKVGIGGKIIQAEEENLESICNGAYWLNWVIGLAAFIIQCVVAFPVASFYHDSQLILPTCLLGIIYLITPIGRIQATLIQRENRLKITAISTTIQLIIGNILTVVLALLNMGMWALILPRILITPIDAIISIYNCKWRRSKGFTTERWREILIFGVNFIGLGLLGSLRNNLDYLIIGRFLGVKELGIYFFAFNAGLGISLSIIQSISTAIYPHLCAVRSNWPQFKKRYFSSLKTIAIIIIPLVFLQSSLAHIYVPIVFGQKWIVGIPILIVICLSAIPRPFFQTATSLLTAIDKPNLSLLGNLLFTILFAVGLLIGVQWQSLGVAIAVLLTHLIFMPLFTVWATRYVFGSTRA